MSNIVRIYNDNLEPNLWNKSDELDPKIRKDLLQIAQGFYKSTEFKSNIIDILLLGSCVNYNWTPESDIDLHIVFDISEEGLDSEHYRKHLDALGGRWNCQHNIDIKGHNVEIYIQDIKDKNSTIPLARKHSGMFSLLLNKWLIFPKKETINIDKEEVKSKFLDLKNRIDKFIKEKDLVDLKELMKFLRNYRNKGLEDEGEFSIENLVFKALRHTGVLEQLKNAINDIYDQKMSIKEFFGDINEKLANTIKKSIKEQISGIETILPEPYILIGAIDDNLNLSCFKNSTSFHLNHLLENIEPLSAIEWKYESDKNELCWSDFPSKNQLEKTKEYLKENHNICNPVIKNVYNVLLEHLIDKNARLYLGFIRRSDFKVVGTDVQEEEYGHWHFAGELGGEWMNMGDSEYIPWRYKRKENTIYWWATHLHPSDDEKKAVEYWLEKNANIKYPVHKFMGHFTILAKKAKMDAHTID